MRIQRARRASRAGLTLLELLLTMGLLGLLLGTGVGVFASLDLGAERSPTVVRSVLTSGRSRASDEGQAVHVLVENEGQELVLRAPRIVASYSFESGASGPRGRAPELAGARRVDDGYLGAGLAFAGGGNDAKVRIDLGDDGRFDLREGFALRMRVRADDTTGGVLLDLGGVVRLEVRDGGQLVGSVVPDEQSRVDLESPFGALGFGRWAEVGMTYDRVRFSITVDGFPVARLSLTDPLGEPNRELILGGRPRPFPGLVDELVIWIYERQQAVVLPEERRWPKDGPTRISFDRDGSLDPGTHPEGFELVFQAEGRDADVIAVSRYGVVR